MNASDAQAENITVEQLAEKTATTWREGLAAQGTGPEQIQQLKDAADVTIYTPGSSAGVPLNVIGSLRRAAALVGHRGRGAAGRDRGHRDEPARPRRGHRRPALEPRARAPLEPDRERLAGRAEPRPRRPDRPDPVSPAPQARRLRDRRLLPAEGPHRAGAEAQRADRVARVRRLGRGRAARSAGAAVHAGRQAARRDRLPRTSLRRGADVRDDARLREARDLDARAVRHLRPARARVHGRGGRLRAADGRTAREEADPDDPQAGPRLRARSRALDPEPGRPRLQGDVERRHLARRPAPDRERQGARARGPSLGGRRCRHLGPRRRDRRPPEAAVHARLGEGLEATRLRDPVGDVVPARAADEGAGPGADEHCAAPGRAATRPRWRASHPEASPPHCRPARRRRDAPSHRRLHRAPRSRISIRRRRGRRRSAQRPVSPACTHSSPPASSSATTTPPRGSTSSRSSRRSTARSTAASTSTPRRWSTSTTATSGPRLPPAPPTCCRRRPSREAKFFAQAAKNVQARLVANRALEIFRNKQLKLSSRPGETQEAFLARCDEAGQAKADEETVDADQAARGEEGSARRTRSRSRSVASKSSTRRRSRGRRTS